MRLADLRSFLSHFGAHADAVPADPPAPAGCERVGAGEAPESADRPRRWTPTRITVADELWGEGFVMPGGEEEVLRLAKPLGLSAAASVLMLGAGSGGPARAVSEGFGAWVAGYEADPALAAAAAWRLPRAGKLAAKRATVSPWDPAAPAFRPRGFHHALALEALRGAPGCQARASDLLLQLAGALRPGGHLVLVEMVAGAPLDPESPELAAWARGEGRTPALATQASLGAALSELGFDVRVAEDISARHIGLAVQGWQGLLHELAASRPDRARAVALVDEAELWMRRLSMMQSGRLSLARFHAIGRS